MKETVWAEITNLHYVFVIILSGMFRQYFGFKHINKDDSVFNENVTLEITGYGLKDVALSFQKNWDEMSQRGKKRKKVRGLFSFICDTFPSLPLGNEVGE